MVKQNNPQKFYGKGDLYLIPLTDFYNIIQSKYLSTEFVSFHQTALIDVLNLFHLTYQVKLKGKLIGIDISESPDQDSVLTISAEMSDEIENKMPDIIKMVLGQIS